jgi:hypothetical protein
MFRKVRLSFNPNRSENHKIKIKSLLDIIIKDLSREELEPENSLGSLIAANMATIEITQAKYAQRVVKAKTKLARKRAKNNTRIKASKIFPKYTNYNMEGFNRNNLPDTISREKDSEEKDIKDKNKHIEI